MRALKMGLALVVVLVLGIVVLAYRLGLAELEGLGYVIGP